MNTLQDVKQYVIDKVVGYRFDAVITRFKTRTYKAGTEAGRYIHIDVKGFCFYIHEEGHNLHTVIECDRIEEQDKKVFIKAWKEEHAATVKINELNEQLEIAFICDKPTKRIENSIKTWSDKQNKAMLPVEAGVKAGVYPVNTVDLIGSELGYLIGYVDDCFWDVFYSVSIEG